MVYRRRGNTNGYRGLVGGGGERGEGKKFKTVIILRDKRIDFVDDALIFYISKKYRYPPSRPRCNLSRKREENGGEKKKRGAARGEVRPITPRPSATRARLGPGTLVN